MFFLQLLILGSCAQMTQQMRDFIVSEHNRLRRTVTTTNMQEVFYDLKLECVAQAWIDNPASGSGMSYTHNANRSTDYQSCGGSGYVGENWYSSAPGPVDPWGGASYAWVDLPWTTSTGAQCSERQCYVQSPSTCTSCTTGHYTQVMWWNSELVGCGYNSAHGTTCNYSPGGNSGGAPYTLGTACSACPTNRPTCDAGLCTAVNECTQGTNNCASTAICTDTSGSFTCTCMAGYTGTGVTCTDVNECTLQTHNCAANATCTNTVGSFTCTCNSGYNGTGVTCTDINECASGLSACQAPATCVNTPGSYQCSCPTGYNASSSTQCVDINECTSGTHNCGASGVCINVPGSYSCSCLPGYSPPACVDINECTTGTHTCSNVSSPTATPATCVNSVGSFLCSCPSGFLLTNLTLCVDQDECALGISTCPGTCINTKGSFTCSCQTGYIMNGNTCVDVNECTQVPSVCTNAGCTNTQGSFTCTCSSGYAAVNATYCADINECTLVPSVCTNAACTNTQGSFTCTCLTGFAALNSTYCSDINECTSTAHCSTAAKCTNTIGSFTCTCNAGYSGSGVTCTNINECTQGTDTCMPSYSGGICTDTQGSFTCSCKQGYTFVPPTTCRRGGVLARGESLSAISCISAPNCTELHRYPCSTIQNTCGKCMPGFIGSEVSNDPCIDVNECLSSSKSQAGHWVPCEQGCMNSEGSYACFCTTGYSLNSDGINCDDINECLNSNGGCQDTICANTIGSYTCIQAQ